jgi:hypothetical protein
VRLAGLRKTVLGWDWFWTRPLWSAIQASAAAAVSKLLTVAGLASEVEIFTPKPPAASETTS